MKACTDSTVQSDHCRTPLQYFVLLSFGEYRYYRLSYFNTTQRMCLKKPPSQPSITSAGTERLSSYPKSPLIVLVIYPHPMKNTHSLVDTRARALAAKCHKTSDQRQTRYKKANEWPTTFSQHKLLRVFQEDVKQKIIECKHEIHKHKTTFSHYNDFDHRNQGTPHHLC